MIRTLSAFARACACAHAGGDRCSGAAAALWPCCVVAPLTHADAPYHHQTGKGQSALPASTSAQARSGADRAMSTGQALPETLLYREAAVAKQDGSGLAGTVQLGSSAEVKDVIKRMAKSGAEVVADPFASFWAQRPLGDAAPVHEKVLAQLLKTPPTSWEAPPPGTKFFLSEAEIIALCDAAELVFRREPNLLKIRAPVKLFGDIHGQYNDLMKLVRYAADARPGCWELCEDGIISACFCDLPC